MLSTGMDRLVSRVLRTIPDAVAGMKGDRSHPDVVGRVELFGFRDGVLVSAWIRGLPRQTENGASVFGFHIHEGMSCTGNREDPFADAGSHYSPLNAEHPRHAGDMPPLFAFSGEAYSCFYLGGVSVPELISRAVIIHGRAHDFTTQPSGNAGAKIACGLIEPN